MNTEKEETVLVVAGSLREFEHYVLRELRDIYGSIRYNKSQGVADIGFKTWRYVSHPNKMRGFHGVQVQFIGSWFKRPDATAFEEQAELARMK